MYAGTLATIWDSLPKEARRGVLSTMSPNDRDTVALAVQQGRRFIRGNQQSSK
jgi:hypothetical protein